MPINRGLMVYGSWSLSLAQVPQAVAAKLEDFGQIIITGGRIDARRLDPLPLSRYTGVKIAQSNGGEITKAGDIAQMTISGPGLVFYLGDDSRGKIFTNLVLNDTFANAIRAALPPSIREGTLYAAGSGNIVQTFVGATSRKVIDFICSVRSAEYRISPQGYLDAGTAAQLYPLAAQPVLVVRRATGSDPSFRPAPLSSARMDADRTDYVTGVWLAAEGQGSATSFTYADLPSIGQPSTPYKDLFGQSLLREWVISESGTDSTLATLRAQGQLAQASALRRNLSLSLEDYEVAGDLAVGETIYVYDPAAGLTDPSIEVRFRGQVLHPAAIRVVGISEPVRRRWGKYFRTAGGEIIDLSEWVQAESGAVTIEVGSLSRKLTGAPAESLAPRVSSDPSIPGMPVFSTFTTLAYAAEDGVTRATITASWSTPLNTDGSTVVDGALYEVGWRITGQTTWQSTSVQWGTNSLTIWELSPGVSYDFRIQAVDAASPPNRSGFSGTTTVIAAPDSVAPSVPAAPTVASNPLQIQVTSTLGKATGGTYNLERDLNHLDVYASTTSGFTPGPTNLLGSIPASAANLDTSVPAIANFSVPDATVRWIKITAVDASGNASGPSGQASATALLIQNANIADATITDAKIANLSVAKLTSGSISAALVELTAAGQLRAGRATSPFNYLLMDSAGIRFYTGGTAQFTGGYLKTDLNVNTGSAWFSGTVEASDIIGGTITGSVLQTAASGRRVVINPSVHFVYFYSGKAEEVAPAIIDSNLFGTGTSSDASLRLRAPQFSGDRGGELELYGHSADGTRVRAAVMRGSSTGSYVFCRDDYTIYGSGTATGHWFYSGPTQAPADLRLVIQGDRIEFWGANVALDDKQLCFRGVADANHLLGYMAAYDGPTLSGYASPNVLSVLQDTRMIVGAGSPGVGVRNASNTGWRPISASAFTVNSSPRHKRQIRPTKTRFRQVSTEIRLQDYIGSDGRPTTGFVTSKMPTHLRREMTFPGGVDEGYNLAEVLAHVMGHVQELDAEVVRLSKIVGDLG